MISPCWRWIGKRAGRAGLHVKSPAARRRATGYRLSLGSLEDRIAPASRLFAALLSDNFIVELNPNTAAVINAFAPPEPVGTGEVGLAFDGTRLFYISGSDQLFELNPNTGSVLDVDPITAGSGTYDGLAVVGGEVYIQDPVANQILVFDPVGDTVTRTLSLATDLLGGLAGASAPGALVGLVNGGDSVAEIDPATGAVTGSFPVNTSDLRGTAVVNGDIYLGSGSTNTILKYSRSGAPLGQITFPFPATVCALASDDAFVGNQFVNGGFESGDTFGWAVFNGPNSNGTGYRAYSGPSPQGSTLPAPPEGAFAAYNDHFGPGSYILYQDVALPAGQFHTLSLQAFYQNQFSGGFVTPDTLDHSAVTNQQFRIDVIRPSADLQSVAAADVLVTAFRTRPGDPLQSGAFTVNADLTPFAGQTVRLRIAVANNMHFLFGGVDDVQLISEDEAPVGTVSGVKFNDLDGDGTRDAGEPGLPGWTVYADQNNNRQLDANEPFVVTGADGSYALTLPLGSFNLREVAQTGWVQTAPVSYPFYATGFDGTRLITIDPVAGTATAVGHFGSDQTWAGAFTPDGTFWTIVRGFDAAQAQLAPVNLGPGAASLVGSPNWVGSPMIALEADVAGNLYGGSFDGRFFRISTTTGAATLVGNLGFTDVMDFAFDNAGTLWAVDGANRLFRVNPATGQGTFASFINGPGFDGQVMGLMVHPKTGTLYATNYIFNSALFAINPLTGVATRVGSNLGIPNPHGGDIGLIDSHTVNVTAGASLPGRDFGNQRDEGTVTGVKFNDLDGDGVRDGGEAGLAGWTIYADLNNNRAADAGEPSTITGADGSYALTLPSGSYNLREVPQAGWIQTSPRDSRLFALRAINTGVAPTVYELAASGAVLNSFPAPAPIPTVGNQGLASSGESVFYIDGSGSAAHTLYELDAATGAVLDSDSIPATPEIAGLAYLGGLVYIQVYPSREILAFDPASDTVVRRFTVGADIIGGLTGAADLGLLFASNGQGQVIAINPQTGALVRVMNTGVGPLTGGLAYLNGELIAMPFGLNPAFRINPQTGAVLGTLTLGGGGTAVGLGGDGAIPGPHRVTVTAGATLAARDFGNQRDEGTVTGVKFHDLDGDGTRDAGEPGLAGWTIYADLNRNGQLDGGEPSAVTGGDGSYSLIVPSGSLALREVAQPGWAQTSPVVSRLFAVRGGANGTTPTVYELDASGAVLNSFPAPAATRLTGPQGLADGGAGLFYIDGAQSQGTIAPRTLYELDPFTGAVRDSDDLPTTPQLSGLAYLNGLVYVLTSNSNINRAAMSQVLPELFADHRIQPVEEYPARLLAALRPRRLRASPSPPWSCSRPACTTPRTSSTPSWPAGWASSSWRAATCSVATAGPHAHDPGQRAGPRHLPAHRRRLPGPRAVPPRLRARVPGILNAARAGAVTIANGVGNGVADDKAVYTVRARHRALLPGRGAGAAERRRPTGSTIPTSGSTSCRGWTDGRQAGGRLRRIRDRRGPGSTATGGAGQRRVNDPGRPARVDRPADRHAVDRAHPGRRPARARGTSTCGRSRSTTGRRCGCCPAG